MNNATLWARPIFVWGVWAGMSTAALLLVGHYGHNVPYYDEWGLVYALAGERPVDFDWLWNPHNGHRIAVPRLLMLGLHAVTGWDFRGGMYASVALLSVASAALIWAAGRSRGTRSYTDAVFPLLLLNLGHYDNMIWGWQITQVLPVAVFCLLLAAIVRWRLVPPLPIAVLASIGVVTLPLSGVPGLACAPGFAMWLLETGRRRWRLGGRVPRREAAVIWTITSLALLLVPAYFVGLSDTGSPAFDALRSAKAVLAFLAHGFGLAGQAALPWLVAVAVGLFAAATLVMLRAIRDTPARRAQALSLFFVLVAFAGIAMSVGIGRPTTSFPHRYFLFAAPGLCWVYLVADLARRERIARAGRTTLLVLSLAAAVYNASAGLSLASARSADMDAFEADVRAGMAPSELVARHQRTVLPFPEEGGAYWHEPLSLRFDVLRRAGIGAFAALAPEPGFREVAVRDVAEQSFIIDSETPVSGWIWEFVEARHIAGVRIVPQHAEGGAEIGMSMLKWTSTSSEPFSNDRRYVHWWTSGEASATVWIYDTITTLRIPLPDEGPGSGAPEARPDLWDLRILLVEHGPSSGTPNRDDRHAK